MGDYARAAVKSNTSLQMLNAVQSLVLSLGLCLVVFLAGWQVVHHAMSAGAHHRLHPDRPDRLRAARQPRHELPR